MLGGIYWKSFVPLTVLYSIENLLTQLQIASIFCSKVHHFDAVCIDCWGL